MQGSALVTVALPIAMAIIMFGLGLSLTPRDFTRVAQSPKAVAGALVVQVVVLPSIAFRLVVAFGLAPELAVGVMLLVASPGGTTANLFSHLFRGDVALNVTLTAINSVLAAFTLPLITNLAIGYFGAGDALGLQFGKVVQVFTIVLVPVLVGMIVRSRWSGFAAAADRPVRVFAIVVLAVVIVGAILGERAHILDYLGQVGVLAALLCVISLSCGYGVARLLRLRRRQATAISMEIGVHNTTIALTIALSVMENVTVAIPSAVYGILTYLLAPTFGWLVTRNRKGGELPDNPGNSGENTGVSSPLV